jgi:hypothetical protein
MPAGVLAVLAGGQLLLRRRDRRALRDGLRGLPGGSSLPLLLAEYRGTANLRLVERLLREEGTAAKAAERLRSEPGLSEAQRRAAVYALLRRGSFSPPKGD